MNTKDFMFSASSVKTYQQCGLKFKFSKIDKLPTTETATHHRWLGTLVHTAIYTSIADPSEGRKSLSIRDTGVDTVKPLERFERLWDGTPEDAIDALLMKEVGEKPVGKFATGALKSLGQNVDDPSQKLLEKGWRTEARKMVKNGIKTLSGIHTISELEKKLFWNIMGRRFIGFVDVLGKDKDGKLEFYDFKTSFKKPSQAAVDDDFQFFAYSLDIKDKLKLDYYPVGNFVHLRSGTNVPFDLNTNDKFPKMIGQLKNTFSNMEDNLFFADYGSPLCAYCDYRHICYGEENQPEVKSHGN